MKRCHYGKLALQAAVSLGSPEGGHTVAGNGSILGEDRQSVAHGLGDKDGVKRVTVDEGEVAAVMAESWLMDS
ncbi:MAG: hypothetical protein ACYCYR_04495 [Desulfobulbaceae bacterium]|jgi:hypothetical protein